MKPRPFIMVFSFGLSLVLLHGDANVVSLTNTILKSNKSQDQPYAFWGKLTSLSNLQFLGSGKWTSQYRDTTPNYTKTISRHKRADMPVYDCPSLNRCAYNKKKIIPNCYCDDLCFVYNDCCIDYPVLARNEKYAQDHIEKINRTVCLPMSVTNKYDGVRAVDTCDPNFSSNINACEGQRINTIVDPLLQLVTGNDEGQRINSIADLLLVTGNDGITYKNEHCAICNGIRNFERWTLGILLDRCPYGRQWQEYKNDNGLNMTYYLYKKGCRFLQFPSKKYPPRFCLRTGVHDFNLIYYMPVACLDKTLPIFNQMDLFGSISCCVENFLFPDECSGPEFSCYESKEEAVTKIKAIGTKSMMVFFEFRPSKVSNFTKILLSQYVIIINVPVGLGK